MALTWRGLRGAPAAALVALILLAGCTPAPAAPTPAPAAPGTADASAPVVPPGPGRAELTVAGRTVAVHVGAAYRPGDPLLVVLHGYTAEGEGTASWFGLTRAADDVGLVVAMPNGRVDARGDSYWNAGACCDFYDSGVDDVGFIGAVVSAVSAAYGTDPARSYLVGHSNGGFLAHRVACEHADQIAGIVSVAGSMDDPFTCAPTVPVSVLQVHGDRDTTIPVAGGTIRPNGRDYLGVEEILAGWRAADRCAAEPTTDAPVDLDLAAPGSETQRTAWSCDAGTTVAWWNVVGGAHSPDPSPAFGAELVGWLEAHGRT